MKFKKTTIHATLAVAILTTNINSAHAVFGVTTSDIAQYAALAEQKIQDGINALKQRILQISQMNLSTVLAQKTMDNNTKDMQAHTTITAQGTVDSHNKNIAREKVPNDVCAAVNNAAKLVDTACQREEAKEKSSDDITQPVISSAAKSINIAKSGKFTPDEQRRIFDKDKNDKEALIIEMCLNEVETKESFERLGNAELPDWWNIWGWTPNEAEKKSIIRNHGLFWNEKTKSWVGPDSDKVACIDAGALMGQVSDVRAMSPLEYQNSLKFIDLILGNEKTQKSTELVSDEGHLDYLREIAYKNTVAESLNTILNMRMYTKDGSGTISDESELSILRNQVYAEQYGTEEQNEKIQKEINEGDIPANIKKMVDLQRISLKLQYLQYTQSLRMEMLNATSLAYDLTKE